MFRMSLTRSIIFSFLILILLIYVNTFVSLSTTTNNFASQGIIDLRNSEFMADSIALLDGNWFFSNDIHSENPSGEYESVPSKWSQYSVAGNKLTSNGVGI